MRAQHAFPFTSTGMQYHGKKTLLTFLLFNIIVGEAFDLQDASGIFETAAAAATLTALGNCCNKTTGPDIFFQVSNWPKFPHFKGAFPKLECRDTGSAWVSFPAPECHETWLYVTHPPRVEELELTLLCGYFFVCVCVF